MVVSMGRMGTMDVQAWIARPEKAQEWMKRRKEDKTAQSNKDYYDDDLFRESAARDDDEGSLTTRTGPVRSKTQLHTHTPLSPLIRHSSISPSPHTHGRTTPRTLRPRPSSRCSCPSLRSLTRFAQFPEEDSPPCFVLILSLSHIRSRTHHHHHKEDQSQILRIILSVRADEALAGEELEPVLEMW